MFYESKTKFSAEKLQRSMSSSTQFCKHIFDIQNLLIWVQGHTSKSFLTEHNH